MFNQPLILSKKNKYIFVGAGASGKDFAKSECIKVGFTTDISFTTRPMRSGEIDGETYNYVSFDTFKEMVDKGEFIQHNQFGNGHFYGTSKKSWVDNSVFIIDPITCDWLRANNLLAGKTVVFFNIPENTRAKRLLNRKDSNDNVQRRLDTDRKDFEKFNSWNVIISDPEFKIFFCD